MKVFNNRDRPNYEQIVDMGPKWWTEYLEMDANYRYAGWTLDLMAHFLEMLVLNEFPRYCDEKTLRIFEQLLGVEYNEAASVDERRRTVAAYWSGDGKISKSLIEAIVSSYTGQHANVRWQGETLMIDFDNTQTAIVSMSMLQRILKRKMPAHIDYQIRCMCLARIGVKASRQKWKTVFDITGTKPNISTGLGLARKSIVIDGQSTRGRRAKHLMPGYGFASGEYPDTSTGLNISHVALNPDVSRSGGDKVIHKMSGTAGETGTEPYVSTGLELSEKPLSPKVSTHSYDVEYALCGEDAFEI